MSSQRFPPEFKDETVHQTMSTTTKQRIIWLTWERQIRNRSMSKALGITLHEILSDRGRAARYVVCLRRTFILLWRMAPKVIVCQNPSLVLTLLLLQLRSLFQFKLVIDAHFGGIEAFNGSRLLQGILDHCNRSADLVIVTNEDHAERVRSAGGKSAVCQDPLPDLSRFANAAEEIPGKVFVICSFDVDEPFGEVFRAAEILAPEGFRLFVSGNYRKAGITPGNTPGVELLGFMPEEVFYSHLFTSQLVIDLTDFEDCLVCGAYEGIAAGKPLVLSRKRALQEYFTGGVVFTDNRAVEISMAIRRAHAERSSLAEEGQRWAMWARKDIKARIDSLARILHGL